MNLTDYDKRAQSQSNKVPAHLEHAIMAVRDTSPQFLESPEGEISFFRSVMRARPVGMHRHFHVLTIRNAIQKDTGHLVSIDDIWVKLRSCYDLDALENLVSILPHGKMIIQTLIPSKEIDGYDLPGSNKSTPPSIPSPSASENLSVHPFFRQEYTLPSDESFEALVSPRRIRATASPPSSPAPSSPGRPGHRKTRRGRSKADMAGLVGGDSDSSALTQESGDEGAPTPRGSMLTDGGTDYAENDWVAHDSSPGQCNKMYSIVKLSASIGRAVHFQGNPCKGFEAWEKRCCRENESCRCRCRRGCYEYCWKLN